MSDPAIALERRIAARLRAELTEIPFLPTERAYERYRATALEDGSMLIARLARGLSAPAGSSTLWSGLRCLGLEPSALSLAAGLGLGQARALAVALDGPDAHSRAIDAAAVLNLLVGLFDFVSDRQAAAGAAFEAALGGDTLARLFTGDRELGRTGLPAVDSVLAVGQHYVDEARALGAGAASRAELVDVLGRMLSGELASLDARRDRGPLDDRTWCALHDKSALPLWAMAVTVAPHALPAGPELDALRDEVTSIGELLWIVDDLIDARADWEAGLWTRPWALNAQRGAESPPNEPAGALAALLGGPVVEQEARLATARASAAIRFSKRHPRSELSRNLGASVESWLRGAEADAPNRLESAGP